MLKLSKSEELLQTLQTRVRVMNHGDRFPSVRQLMKEYGVSQFTVAPALTLLEEAGIIRREVGRGTFVFRPTQVIPKRIAILFPEWPSAAIQDMAKALESETAARQWTSRKLAYDLASDVFSRLERIDADAIILDPPNPGEITPKQLEALAQCRVPVVLVRSDIPLSSINCVCGNNSAAGIVAANYLMRNGHHNIGILISEPHVSTSTELVDSFCNSVRAGGAELTVIDCQTRSGEDSVRSAYVKLKHWLTVNPLMFSALFVVSDESTLGAYKALAEHGIAVPEQLSVMGFGNASTSEFYHPGLTTIDTDYQEMARAALDIAVDQMECPENSGQNYKVSPRVVERKSVIVPK